ncbi:MAG: 50S ribosomal protein L4 [Patescibacteria group bacterium]
MEAQVYDIKGKSTGKINLPENFFGVSWNADLVHQVATSLATNKRTPVAHTKNRGEVRGGGKKPWQQKGTGRARHGSSRSPIWVGGGVTHGPRNEKNYSRTVSKKMKSKALYTILSAKWRDGEILFVDSLNFAKPKTKEALAILKSLSGVKGFEKLSTKKRNAVIVALSAKNVGAEKSMRNIGSIETTEIRNLNPLALLNHKYLIIENPEESLKKLPTHGKEK